MHQFGLRSSVVAIAPHKLEEAARFSVGGPFLVQKRQLAILEGFEELVPVDIFETVAVTELDAQHTLAVVALGALDNGRPAVAAVHPSAYALMVGRGLGCARVRLLPTRVVPLAAAGITVLFQPTVVLV